MAKLNSKPRAFLKAFREPLFDTEYVMDRFDKRSIDIDFFKRPRGQMTDEGGICKTYVHTNMSQSNQLGLPEQFEVEGFKVEFLKGIVEEIEEVVMSSVMDFSISNRSKYYEFTLSSVNPIYISSEKGRVMLPEGDGRKADTDMLLKKIADARLNGEEVTMSSLRSMLGMNYIKAGISIMGDTDTGGEIQKIPIGSVEQFGVRIRSHGEKTRVSEPFLIRVYITGTHYKVL